MLISSAQLQDKHYFQFLVKVGAPYDFFFFQISQISLEYDIQCNT